MNKLLVAVFDTESAANSGLNALRNLHAAGDITLFATAVLVRDVEGVVSVKQSTDSGPIGTATGLAVGSLVGLLGGPVGVAIGALQCLNDGVYIAMSGRIFPAGKVQKNRAAGCFEPANG